MESIHANPKQNPVVPPVPGWFGWIGGFGRGARGLAVVDGFAVQKATQSRWQAAVIRPAPKRFTLWGFSGYTALVDLVEPWRPNATLDEIRRIWPHAGYRTSQRVDQILAAKKKLDYSKVMLVFQKTLLFNYEAEPLTAYQLLEGLRSALQDVPASLEQWLYTVIYYQGVTAMRRGETDNCVHCRGACSCILPLAPSAYHTDQTGSRLAIRHFTEHLDQFPDDFEVRWLLNVAHMTLGEYPDKVVPN